MKRQRNCWASTSWNTDTQNPCISSKGRYLIDSNMFEQSQVVFSGCSPSVHVWKQYSSHTENNHTMSQLFYLSDGFQLTHLIQGNITANVKGSPWRSNSMRFASSLYHHPSGISFLLWRLLSEGDFSEWMQSTQCTPPINMENNFNFMFLKTLGYVLRYFRVGSLFPRDLFF